MVILNPVVVINSVTSSHLGDMPLAIETLLTAIAVIKQSRVYGDERCRALVTSLKDCLFSIESKSYGSRSVLEKLFVPLIDCSFITNGSCNMASPLTCSLFVGKDTVPVTENTVPEIESGTGKENGTEAEEGKKGKSPTARNGRLQECPAGTENAP